MAGIFTPGQQTTTTNPSQPSAASAALKLFIIQLLMSRLQQTGGAPQTFGNYLSQGPRKMDTNQLSAGLPDLMKVLQQPGAFNSGPKVEKTQPSSPSLFQDLAGLAPLGALGYQIYKGGNTAQESPIDNLLKMYIMKQWGGGMGGGTSAGLGGGGSAVEALPGGLNSGTTNLGTSDLLGSTTMPTLSSEDLMLGQLLNNGG